MKAGKTECHNGNNSLQNNKESFPAVCVIMFQAEEIPHDRDNIGNKSRYSAEDQVAETHKQKLKILCQQNPVSVPDQTNAYHNDRAGQRNQIAGDQ